MFKVCLLVCLVFVTNQSISQIATVRGKVKHFKSGDTVELNTMPFGTEYYRSYSKTTIVDTAGDFEFDLRGDGIKFYLLKYKNFSRWLLVSPDRPMIVVINPEISEKFVCYGPGAEENYLVDVLRPEDLPFSENMESGRGSNPYLKYSLDSVANILVPIALQETDSALRVIDQANIPINEKEILEPEIKFYYRNRFSHFLTSGWSRVGKNDRTNDMLKLFDIASKRFGFPPEAAIQREIPSACEYLADYWEMRSLEASYDYMFNHDKPGADSVFKATYGISYTEREQLFSKSGYVYAEAVAASKILPKYAFEKWACGKLMFRIAENDIYSSSLLLKMLSDSGCKSQYLVNFQVWVNNREQFVRRNNSNPNIRFREDANDISNLDQVLGPYKGKPVCLIIFHPTFNRPEDFGDIDHELITKYEKKGVQFVYISIDYKDTIERWLSFIYNSGFDGDHILWGVDEKYDSLDKIWEKLEIAGRADQRLNVPSLYVFDASGKPVVSKLHHPFSRQTFATAIEKALSIKYEGVKYGDSSELAPGVKIRPDYLSVSNLEALLTPYRGKLVYLDMWGTWCAPCMSQMDHLKDLEERYKGKDVVFLFVDRDEQKADETWRKVIKSKKIQGEHVRLNGEQIAYLWDSFQTASDAYPTFFLFDRNGKLTVKDAKWPMDGQELYDQIDGLLRSDHSVSAID